MSLKNQLESLANQAFYLNLYDLDADLISAASRENVGEEANGVAETDMLLPLYRQLSGLGVQAMLLQRNSWLDRDTTRRILRGILLAWESSWSFLPKICVFLVVLLLMVITIILVENYGSENALSIILGYYCIIIRFLEPDREFPDICLRA